MKLSYLHSSCSELFASIDGRVNEESLRLIRLHGTNGKTLGFCVLEPSARKQEVLAALGTELAAAECAGALPLSAACSCEVTVEERTQLFGFTDGF